MTLRLNSFGCLLVFILCVYLFFELKLYYVAFATLCVLLSVYLYLRIKEILEKKHIEQEKNFEPEVGETYKICPHCNSECKRSAEFCPNCKYKF